MTEQNVTPDPQEQPVNPAPVDEPSASLEPTHSDVLPQITTEQPAPTAGEMRAAGYDVPADIPDDEAPHRYAADQRADPGDPPRLVGEFPPHGVPRWEDGKVVGGDEA